VRTPPELDELEADFRRRRIARFEPDDLLGLAALPEWTDQRAAGVGFPRSGQSLAALLDRLDQVGLLARRTDLDAHGQLVTAFWLPASRRAEVGAYLRSVWTTGQLERALAELADRLRAMPSDLLEDVRPWLRVVEVHLDDPSGIGLLTTIERLVDVHPRSALGLVGAAKALGDVLGEPLVSSARRAQWAIDRAHRRLLDARTVAHYLPHPAVDQALARLIAGAGGSWAVHLLGNGGVGKTMALRDLSSGRFAARCLLPQPMVARVDFDHLDPRGRPGELLLALIGELFTFNRTRESESWFRSSDDALAHLHEAVSVGVDARDPRLLDRAVEPSRSISTRSAAWW
jgi:hypothetical protein